MRLLESEKYIHDLKKAIDRTDLSLLNGKTFFITGGLGLICSAVIDILLTYKKTGKIYVGARNVEQFNKRFGKLDKVIYIEYDALKKLKLEIIPDYIICGASLANPELYIKKPVETILSNFDGVQALLEFSKLNNIKRLLYISSSEVYGKKDTMNSFKEESYGVVNIDDIRSSYSIAKRASEMLCKSYCIEYDIDVVIVRPGHIYGPSAKRSDKRIASEFIYKAAMGKNLIMKSDGFQKRSYCYTIDCAIQILTALQKGKCGEAYNIGHDEVTTIRKMAQIIANAGKVDLLFELPSDIEKQSFNPMNNSALCNNKIKKLGYRDIFTVEEGLTHTVEILKEIQL